MRLRLGGRTTCALKTALALKTAKKATKKFCWSWMPFPTRGVSKGNHFGALEVALASAAKKALRGRS